MDQEAAYWRAVIERAERSLEKDGYSGGSPLGMLSVEMVFNKARVSADRSEASSGWSYDICVLAVAYCDEAEKQLKRYQTDLRRWQSIPRTARGAKPRKPTHAALAQNLSPSISRSAAIERLDKARCPLRLAYLKRTDPLGRKVSGGRRRTH